MLMTPLLSETDLHELRSADSSNSLLTFLSIIHVLDKQTNKTNSLHKVHSAKNKWLGKSFATAVTNISSTLYNSLLTMLFSSSLHKILLLVV